MTDYSDLIARLRAMQSIRRDSTPLSAALRACHEAADALEAQAREIADLQAGWQRTYDHDVARLQERLAAAERERDELLTLRHQFAEENSRLFAERTALRAERDEAVRKYEERVRQHEEYIAFADEEITGLIEKKRMVLVSLDEAVALLREARMGVKNSAVQFGYPYTEYVDSIDAFLAKHKEQQ